MAKPTQKTFVTGQNDGPVECLGMTFPNDQARREYFLGKLKESLRDPDFRKIEGFPIGEDEDILTLSDPPYYTACPNPFLAEFIKRCGKLYDPAKDDYSREPFATDVSEGKNDPIYNAHSYHTKVPHKAIMRCILHYTEPGDIVFDGFCGTGMTGVASQMCGDRATVGSLGYRVNQDGTILDADGTPFARLGARKAVLGDLSPAATFIAYNYNTPVDSVAFGAEAERILADVEANSGWMYLTLDRPKSSQIDLAITLLKTHRSDLRKAGSVLPWGRINYTIWSDVFLCSECSGEVVFWDAAVDEDVGEVRNEFPCPHCAARLKKRSVDRAYVTVRDFGLNQTIRQAKQVPVLINYTVGKQRLDKKPDEFDRALVSVIENDTPEVWFPTDRMPEGEESRRNDDAGITHSHHFFTQRNIAALGIIREAMEQESTIAFYPGFAFTAMQRSVSRLASIAFSYYFHGGGGAINAGTKGTLYVSSTVPEVNVIENYRGRLNTMSFSGVSSRASFVQVASANHSNLPGASVDYVFTDPPFGGNLMYSELNFLWECWLRLKTDNRPEAIENKVQKKGLLDYQRLMTECFVEYHRVLKPGRWMTVEFHNSQNRVWAAIQEAIQHAGFVVSDVRTLDKKQGSFKQYNSANAVKQDLVISAYKPSRAFEEHFRLTAGSETGAWEFVRSHLHQIPVFVTKSGRAEVIAERQSYLLFDRMVAFHVQRGYGVPLSASEFYAGLRQRFPERDGMFFLSEQVSEYDRKRLEVREVEQLELFVSDERGAIQWVRRLLEGKPTRYQALQPLYMREAQRVWEKHEQPLELLTILEQNFVKDPDSSWRVPDPKKEADLEQIRNRALLKEFQQYLDTKGKLKIVRTEALRAGFKECWQKGDYTTIIQMAKRVPEAVVQEDPALLMYYDNALMRIGE